MKQYSVADLVIELINEYKLPHESVKNAKTNNEEVKRDDVYWKNYRQQISRAIHNLGLWDSAIIKKKGKKEVRYFTESQKEIIFNSKYLHDYARVNSENEKIKKSAKYKDKQKIIDKAREDHIDYLSSLDMEKETNGAPVLTFEEFRKEKEYLMIKAIFDKFFTPLNEDLFYNDLYQYKFIQDEMDLSIADLAVRDRLQNPNPAYFHDKK